MKRIFIFLLFLIFIFSFSIPVFADSEEVENNEENLEISYEETEIIPDIPFIDETTFEEVEDFEDLADFFDIEIDDDDDLDSFVYDNSMILDDIYFLLEERLPLGFSDDYVSPPDIASLLPNNYSVVSQSSYPYTGGAFISVNSNWGSGLIVLTEPCKVDTLGFRKGTDRIVNLTNSVVQGFFVLGSNTYNLQIPRYGEPQYQYYNGSSWIWRSLTISKVLDSNINFLDETSKRGIENIVISPINKVFLVLFVIADISLLVILVRRRN